MASEKEISSTEKLLDIIRNDGTSGLVPGSDGTLRSKGGSSISFSRDKSLKKSISVGIDIGNTELRLVKVAQPSQDEWRLLDYRNVPLKGIDSSNMNTLAAFLKREVAKFSGSIRNTSFWALLSAANVEVQQIRIPKVRKSQIENAVFWTAKKNFSFDEKEVVFDFDIQGEVTEGGATKLEVLVYTVPHHEVRQAQVLFGTAGIPLAGLTIAPFAIQNIFRTKWIPTLGRTVSTLYIGREWSRIDIFTGGNLAVTRGIRTGVNSMIEALRENYNETRRTNISNRDFQDSLDKDASDLMIDVSMDMEEAKELLYGMHAGSESALIKRFNITEQEIFNLIHSSLERLVRQIERTFEHYTVTLGNERIQTIYVSMSANVGSMVVDFIGDQLGIEKDILDPFDPKSPFVDSITSETSVTERTSFAPALGLALSSLSETPNLIFTYKDKEQQNRIKLINRVIVSALAFMMACSVGAMLWFGHVADGKRATLRGLEAGLIKGVTIDEKTLAPMVQQAKEEQKIVREYGKRYLGLAAIGELAALTPENIRLLGIKAKMGSVTQRTDTKTGSQLIVDGIIQGAPDSFESTLAEYVLEFENSLMFETVKVYKTYSETRNKKKVFHFIININLVEA